MLSCKENILSIVINKIDNCNILKELKMGFPVIHFLLFLATFSYSM